MPTLNSEDVRSALVNKLGCREERDKDHIWFILYDGETVLARTKISHGPRHDIGDDLITLMKRQRRLGTSKNFVGMVVCTLSKEECMAIIRSASGPYR